MKATFAVLALLFSTSTFAATGNSCAKGEAKLIFASKSAFQGRILLAKPRFCANGQIYRIMGAQTSVYYGTTINLATGLCRAIGFGATVSFEPSFLRKAERLAHFEQDGAYQGIFPVYPAPNPNEFANYVVSSLTCEPKN